MNSIQEVIKRDKCIVPFCPEKIIEAVEKAEQATDSRDYTTTSSKSVRKCD